MWKKKRGRSTGRPAYPDTRESNPPGLASAPPGRLPGPVRDPAFYVTDFMDFHRGIAVALAPVGDFNESGVHRDGLQQGAWR